jgi:hypothetical protein
MSHKIVQYLYCSLQFAYSNVKRETKTRYGVMIDTARRAQTGSTPPDAYGQGRHRPTHTNTVVTARRAQTGSTVAGQREISAEPEFPLVWTGSLVDGKFWVVRDTLMETLSRAVFRKKLRHTKSFTFWFFPSSLCIQMLKSEPKRGTGSWSTPRDAHRQGRRRPTRTDRVDTARRVRTGSTTPDAHEQCRHRPTRTNRVDSDRSMENTTRAFFRKQN